MSNKANMGKLHERHSKGDKRAVLDALFVCVCSEPPKPVPDWARSAFRDAYGQVFGAVAASWDDVFGKPKSHPAQRRRRKLAETAVWKRCRNLIVEGWAKDDKLFREVGKLEGVGARQAKKMYYAIERAGGADSNLWTLRPPRRPSVPEKL